MLALRRRTQNAQRQLSSRKAKSGKKHGGRAGWEVRQKVGHQNRIMNQNNNILRQERWENWFLGPLRTGGISGIGKDGEGAGGLLKKQTIPPEYKLRTKDRRVMKKDALLEANKEAARKGISASPNFLRKAKNRRVEETIVEGDRVVIRAFNGPAAAYRGRIGTIVGIDRTRKICVVDGMTIRQARAPKVAPKYTVFSQPHWDPEHKVLLPIPFSFVRLVKTIVNEDGQKEDVIMGKLSDTDLKHMGRGAEVELRGYDEDAQDETDTRRLEGESEDNYVARQQAMTNLTPEEIRQRFRSSPTKPSVKKDSKDSKKAKEEDAEDLTTDSDTLRLELDLQTWTPTLLRAPLPESVIDELRGKYSRFRTRHDPEFIKRLQRIDSARQAYEKWAKSGGGVMDTPRKEAVLRREAEGKETIKREGRGLNDDVLQGIGKMMWEKGMRLTEKQAFQTADSWKQKYSGVLQNR